MSVASCTTCAFHRSSTAAFFGRVSNHTTNPARPTTSSNSHHSPVSPSCVVVDTGVVEGDAVVGGKAPWVVAVGFVVVVAFGRVVVVVFGRVVVVVACSVVVGARAVVVVLWSVVVVCGRLVAVVDVAPAEVLVGPAPPGSDEDGVVVIEGRSPEAIPCPPPPPSPHPATATATTMPRNKEWTSMRRTMPSSSQTPSHRDLPPPG